MAADLAVATDDASFALPETHIGAYPPYAAARIGAICGKKRLLELVLTGDPVDADRALEWGLINRVVSPAALDETVTDYVDAITEAPAAATGLAKRYVHAALAADSQQEHEWIREGFDSLADEPACLEAARVFLNR